MTADGMKQIILEIAKRNNYELTDSQLASIELDDIAVNVAFLGEFASGKSSIVNCLIGRNLLPTYDQPTTATIVEISPGESDEYYVERLDEAGEKQITPLALHQLAHEVTTSETNKKIRIVRKEFGILNRDVLIVDTPGVSSINETHTDITCGYLPIIDVAFFVIPANQGSITESFIQFLSGLPKNFLSKVYFVINKIDLLPESAIVRVEEQLHRTLSKVITNPRIIKVSAREALKNISEGAHSSVNNPFIEPIVTVINDEVPQLLKQVEDKRRKGALREIAVQVLDSLEVKISGLSYSNDEISDKIKTIKSDIEATELEISSFKEKFEDFRAAFASQLSQQLEDKTRVIAAKLERKESIEAEVAELIEELNNLLDIGLNKLEGISKINFHNSIPLLVSSELENETKLTVQIADTVRDIMNFFMWLVIIPGAGVAEKVVGGGHTILSSGAEAIKKYVETDKNIIKKISKFQKNNRKVLGFLGEFSKALDPIGMVKSFAVQNLLISKVKGTLGTILNNRIQEIFNHVEDELSLIIEQNYRLPMNSALQSLDNLRSEREKKNVSIELLHVGLQSDISRLKELIKE